MFLYSMILYSLQHFRLCSSILNYYNNKHNVNVNTFCKCKHDTFLRKKILQRNEEEKKILQSIKKRKNILPTRLLEKKKLADQKSSTPLSRVKWSAPYPRELGAICHPGAHKLTMSLRALSIHNATMFVKWRSVS